MAHEDGWTSPSDLADYAYCPRAHWYRTHPPERGPSPAARRRSRDGLRYHRRVLSAERRRAERGSVYWAGLLIGLALLAGGLLWSYRF